MGNWAERNGIAYGSYQELAGHPEVYAMVRGHVEEVNRSLAADPALAGCQVRRFLILHKELDADDGELTRTRKVRRRVIEEKYADLVRALYDGSETGGDRDRGHLRGRAEGGDPGDAERSRRRRWRRRSGGWRRSEEKRGGQRVNGGFFDARFMHNACTRRMRAHCAGSERLTWRRAGGGSAGC